MFPDELLVRAAAALESCRRAGRRISTAESCTGGLVAGLLTEIAGSSEVFDRAFVTYSNEAKVDMLGVPSSLLAEHGAVSEAVARAMAAGALERSGGNGRRLRHGDCRSRRGGRRQACRPCAFRARAGGRRNGRGTPRVPGRSDGGASGGDGYGARPSRTPLILQSQRRERSQL